MRRSCTLLWSGILLLSALTGCSSGGSDRTASEWTTLYQEAIAAHGGEMVEYNPVIQKFDPEDTVSTLALESLGLAEEDVEAMGVSTSVMNTQAYAIAAVQPAEGKEEAVREALQGYISRQQSNFEFYLPDQYEVAQNAKLDTLSDGTVLLVMCPDADQIFQAIQEDLESAA